MKMQALKVECRMYPKPTKPELDWHLLCNAKKDKDYRAASK